MPVSTALLASHVSKRGVGVSTHSSAVYIGVTIPIYCAMFYTRRC
jgi:hypothetical protein